MISENKNNISARWMTYGIVVQGNEDSGWKITGRSPGLLEEKCYQLEAFTSAGQVSENWAKIFENGYGYFGKLDKDAVFAHFYRSDVQSARGRYFVPRSILLIPFQEYIDQLHCEPTTVFEELKKNKPTSYGDINAVIELAPIKIPPKREHAFPFELTELENIDETSLMDFLSCVLQPEPFDTIIWGGEQPDIELLFSLLFLLPRTLRKFITFCTCVESLNIERTRVKIVKDLPTSSGNSSLIIMKDKQINVREKRIHKHTLLPKILVKTFKQSTDSLNTLHHNIDSKIDLLYEANFEAALKRTETLCHNLNRQIQIDAIPDAETKYRELVSYGLESKNCEQEREFIIKQIENGINEFKTGERADIQDQLAQLMQMLAPIRPREVKGFTKRFWELTGTGQISRLLPLLKIYISIPLLNEAIMSNLFEKLAFDKIARWDETFEILSLIQNKSQLDQLNKNAQLLTQFKQHKEAELFLVLLDLIFNEKEPPWEFLESIADEVNGEKIFDIFRAGFKYFENLKEENRKILFFLLTAACMYPYIPGLSQKKREVFETLFIKFFSRAIFSKAREKADEIINQIIKKIGSFNQAFAACLEAVLKRRTLIDCMTGVTNLFNDKEILPLGDINEAVEFFQLLDNLDNKTGQPLNLVSAFFNLAVHSKTIPASILFPGYIDYLQKKQVLEENDLQILISALARECSALENPDFFREVLSLVFTRCKGKSLSLYLQLLFMLAKDFLAKNNKYKSDLEYHVVKMLEENWNPTGISEIREIYKAISFCFDIVTIHKVLEFGLSRCFKNDTEKKEVLYLVKMVKDLAVIGGKEEPFEIVLDSINLVENNNQPFSNSIDNFSTGIRRKNEAYKSMIGRIDMLQKRMKKVK